MPKRALYYTEAQYILPAREIGPKLLFLLCQDRKAASQAGSCETSNQTSVGAVDNNLHSAYPYESEGEPSVFACPECHGVLWELKDHEMVRFRCRVGHSFGPESLSADLSQSTKLRCGRLCG